MSYRPNDPVYNLAFATYDRMQRMEPERNWPDWDSPEAKEYRELCIRVVREQRGEIPKRKRKLWVRCVRAIQVGIKEFRRE